MPAGVVAMLALAALLNYVDRGNLATAAPVLQDELALSSSQIGLLLSAFFWAYAPSQLLAGWLVHRYDIRLVLGAGVLLWSAATTLTGLANGFVTLLLLRLLLGLGESVTFPSWALILARHSAEGDRGRLNGLVSSGQGFGPMIGTLFGGLAIAHFGWRAMFVGIGVITCLWLVPWFRVSRGGVLKPTAQEHSRSVTYGEILRQRAFWGSALGQFFMNIGFYFVISWMPSFLVKAGGFTVSHMAMIGAAIYAIYAIATVIVGDVSDRWMRRGGSPTLVRKTFFVIAGLGTAVCTGACAFVVPHDAVWLLGVTAVFFGFSTPMIFAVSSTLAGPRASGRWTGAQNLSGQIAGIIAPFATGVLLDLTGTYAAAFAMAAITAVAATVAWGVVIPKIAPVKWVDKVNEPAPDSNALPATESVL
ncbi:MAG TPA: MFS transporter [Steroidobacteraceae bacterium]|nr:MFS transporter [Steroidobacteraceae bacterium]